ncbi:dynamin family protein [Brevibacillus borstelensis]|uniref:dynamin family protein n=1 Tax=Brevibacillus borstelensis TaxID=45462 RepID=UPI00203DE5E3|nr:dynamin family protein [Brevibacillus borstelensis]MCM3623676.1 dynamin family protein [Brevibacillus borstelensis]
MKDFDLKGFREKLGYTQAELASVLQCGQDYISRMEKNPGNMSLDFFMNLCSVARMLPNDVLSNFKLEKPKALEIPDVYGEETLKKEALKYYIAPKIEEYNKKPEYQTAINKILELAEITNIYGAKPLVALLGPSDAGKSTMINSLTGIDALLSQWTPTTSSTVYVKHINDKPSWMGNNNVCIFKAEAHDKGWNFRKIHDMEYCKEHILYIGDYHILEKHCNRNLGTSNKEVDSAVVYLDSNILLSCDIVDLPGFGTEEMEDTVRAQRAKDEADIVLFLCQSNSFLNKQSDILFLKDVIRTIPIFNTNEVPLLSNLFVIASQAHVVGPDKISHVLDTRSHAFSEQLSDELIQQIFNVNKREFVEIFKKRFFSYSLDTPVLREKFEKAFRELLVNQLPSIRKARLNNAIEEFKSESRTLFANEVKKYETILKDRENSKKEYEKAVLEKPKRFEEINALRNQVISFIEKSLKNNTLEMKLWEKETITESYIVDLINEKNYDKKQAKEFLLSNISDLYYAKMQEILKGSVSEFNTLLTQFFEDVEKKANSLSKISVGNVQIPFDFKGALAGGIAGATVLGGLGLWAATVGNLGGYILVAKGVSLLSALGISVGGTAAAASFVALIGGPITIGIAIALGVFAIVSSFFGDGWKKRIAKEVVKTLEKEQVINSYLDAITKFWNDSKIGLNEVVVEILHKIEEHLENLKVIIETNDPKTIENMIQINKGLVDFFGNLPWEGSGKTLLLVGSNKDDADNK